MEVTVERRTGHYTFENKGDLIRFFSMWMPKPVIKAMINEVKSQFIPRRDSDSGDTRLQFLRKCELKIAGIINTREKYGVN